MSSLFSRSKDQPRPRRSTADPPSPSSPATKSPRHERVSRLGSGPSDGVKDRPAGQMSSDGVKDRPAGQMSSDGVKDRPAGQMSSDGVKDRPAGQMSSDGVKDRPAGQMSSDGVKDRPAGQMSSDGVKDRAAGQMSSESYAVRRENRLAARRAEQEAAGTSDYKKIYEEAVVTRERLKTRLEGSKQELVTVQTQLDRVNQRKGRTADSCRSNVQLETEKKERRTLEKKISDMEEELKVQTDLKMENQRLKDENGALIRVISKLSK